MTNDEADKEMQQILAGLRPDVIERTSNNEWLIKDTMGNEIVIMPQRVDNGETYFYIAKILNSATTTGGFSKGNHAVDKVMGKIEFEDSNRTDGRVSFFDKMTANVIVRRHVEA